MKEKDINKLNEYAKKLAEEIGKVSLDMQKEIFNLTGNDAKLFKIKEEEIKTKIEELNSEGMSLRDKLNSL